ncbi:MAG: hypothetical protein NTU43_00150 [Bacteroidetes bacterium]|nr:hypothetical protein [Bacteroidota bacterium]
MKKIIVIAIVYIAACNKPVSPLQKEINEFEHIVDSFLQVNQDFRETYDTVYQEIPIDPTDPEIIKIDTVIYGPNNKKSIFYNMTEGGHPFSDAYKHTYNYRTELLDSLMTQMSDKQRTEYLVMKNKLQMLMPKY